MGGVHHAPVHPVFIAVLAACSGPEGATSPVDTGAAPDIANHLDGTAADDAMERNVAETFAAVDAAMAVGIPDPRTASEAALAILELGDDGTCPSSTLSEQGGSFECTATTGYAFSGFFSLMELEEPNGQAEVFSADFLVIDPAGETFHAGGRASLGQTTGGSWYANLTGSWVYPVAEGWLEDGASSNLTAEGTSTGPILTGSARWADASLNFHQVGAEESCGDGVSGSLDVRDPGGSWLRLDLEDCTPCGVLQDAAGEALGEGCLDALPDALVALDERLLQ